MSFFDSMISRERVLDSYEGWKTYRDKLTTYIINQFGTDYAGTKPVISLWGIGQSADMDLGRLTDYFRLVLIDRDLDAVRRGADHYGLSASDYIALDIPFWNISDDDYRLFEAMLLDEVETDHIVEYFEKLALKNSHLTCWHEKELFDISVAVGLHSQLNSRFAALLFHFKDSYSKEELSLITAAISSLNEAGVTRLNDIMYATTKESLMYGYELAATGSYRESERIMKALEEGKREELEGLKYIEGITQLMKDISIHNGCDIEVINNRYDVWPFITGQGEKNYVMGFTTLRKIM